MLDSLVIYKPSAALLKRREMAKMSAVLDALEPLERTVFLCSTATTIAEYPGVEMAAELKAQMQWIFKDIGFRCPNEGEMQYLVIRTAEILKRYYGMLTMKDFKLAFEFAITGELDSYLPKGRDGQPDRGHYQQFNAEYLCKILNAYRYRRAAVLRKASDAVPVVEAKANPAEVEYFKRHGKRECIETYLYFKYHDRLPAGITSIGVLVCYQCLEAVGLAEEIEITAEEQRAVFQSAINAFARAGMVSDSERLKKAGIEAKELEGRAYLLARKKALIRTFRWMVNNEIQITDFIRI